MRQIRKDKDAKADLDKRRDAAAKHNEVALVRQERQKYDAEMGDVAIRNSRYDSHMHRHAHLSNVDLARRAMQGPASFWLTAYENDAA